MRLMIASKFWSRSTYLKPYPGLIGHVIGDSVLYPLWGPCSVTVKTLSSAF